MTDTFSKQQRSEIMSKIRSRGNAATELRFIDILKKHGISGWRRGISLPGNPDFAFQTARVAVFIDGDFWHGNPRKFRLPKTNVAYWEKKVLGNRKRDAHINRQLRGRGWQVLRIWQSSLKSEDVVTRRVRRALDKGMLGKHRRMNSRA